MYVCVCVCECVFKKDLAVINLYKLRFHKTQLTKKHIYLNYTNIDRIRTHANTHTHIYIYMYGPRHI